MEQQKNKISEIVNLRVFIPSATVLAIIVTYGYLVPSRFTSFANAGLNFVLKYFTWFLAPAAFVTVVFCFWAGFSKYGNIRLGGKEAKPKMTFFTWFSIALTTGTGCGLVFYGVYEPVNFFNNPPPFSGVEGGSLAALFTSFNYVFLHWTVHPYSIFTACGLCMVFLFFNAKRKYLISEMFYPLLGEKVSGKFADTLDSIMVMLIIAGTATSLGFATLQSARGAEHLFGITSNAKSWFFIIIVMVSIYTAAGVSGIEKGITLVSKANMYLYFFLMAFAFVFIDPIGSLEMVFSTVGSYIQNFIGLSFDLDPIARSGWVGGNSVFYYCWWAVFAPFIGMFLVKLAYGRTIRQFVVVNLVAPVLFSFVWFTLFGGGGIILDYFHGASVYRKIASVGPDMAIYALFDELPIPLIMNAVCLLVVLLSMVTMGESLTVAIASMTAKSYKDETGLTKPPKMLNIFWGASMGAFSYLLLLTGGIAALQTSVIITGLPTFVLLLLLMRGYVKTMYNLRKYDLTGDYAYLNDTGELTGLNGKAASTE